MTEKPVSVRRSVNIRPLASVIGNAAMIVPATLFAAAGGAGLVAGGAAVAGGTALAIRKARKKAAAQRTRTLRTTTRSSATKGSTTKGGVIGGARGAKGAGIKVSSARGPLGKALGGLKGAKGSGSRVGGKGASVGRALSSPFRAAGTARRALASNGTARAAGSSARRRGQVAAALSGKPNRSAGRGAAVMAKNVGRIRDAWRKSGAEMKAKRRAELRKKVAAERKANAAAKTLPSVARAVRTNASTRPTAQQFGLNDSPTKGAVAPRSFTAQPLPAGVRPLNPGGRNMSSSASPMTQMLDLAQQMTAVASRWRPNDKGERIGMLDVIAELEKWPEVIREVSRAAKAISDMATGVDGLPLHPVVLDVIQSIHGNQRAVAGTADEVGPLARKLMRPIIDAVQSLPTHANNGMWSPELNQ